jgi:hypothetical protein
MFVVAIEAWPSHVLTVTGSTPCASHRHAAVCRRSWIRRPGATVDQDTDRLTAVTCSWCPVFVVSRRVVRPLAFRARPHQRKHPIGHRHSTVLARLGQLRLHAFRSGPADEQDRHRNADEVAHPNLSSSDHRRPVQAAISSTSARRSSRAEAAIWNDSSSS